jgi:hypothetical protein
VTTRSLGHIPQPDERNDAYPIRALVGTKSPRSYSWSVPNGVYLDQSSPNAVGYRPLGACVGFAYAYEAAARPAVVGGVDNRLGHRFYEAAQRIDPWEGEEPTFVGTSVLAGAQVYKAEGFCREYRWAKTVDELALAIGYEGPGIGGFDWHEGMMDTDDAGFIWPTGAYVGGHAVIVRASNVKRREFLIRCAWDRFGINDTGDAKLTWDAMAELLARQWAEVCFPIGRQTKPS